MAKNGQNDLIFGKLVISNVFKRPIGLFLKILNFGRFFAFLGSKTAILAQKMRKNGQKSEHGIFSDSRTKIGEKSTFSKSAQ